MSLWGKKDTKTVAGTISVTNDSVDVTGSSTAFTTGLRAGQTLVIAGVEYRVDSIQSNTALKLKTKYAGSTASGLTVTANEQPAYIPVADLDKVYFVDTTEISAGSDNVVSIAVVQGGSGYVEAPAVSISSTSGSNAAATATIANGAVTAITITNVGSGYEDAPTVNVNVPRLTIATSGITISTDTVSYTGHGLTAGEAIRYYANGGSAATGLTNATTYYAGQVTANAFKVYNTSAHAIAAVSDKTIATADVNTTDNTITITAHGYTTGVAVNYNRQGGTAITGLTSGTDYYVIAIDADTIKLAATAEDALAETAIDISGTGNDAQTLASVGRLDISGTGNNDQYFDKTSKVTATATAALGTGAGGTQVTHSGWVKRTVGTGGRAGRIQYETLVAMGTPAATSGDAADDTVFPDA